ncbi:hypothetical protein UF75_2445 [Desulfosporosinus sp. I2]|nr:hypothetical protein UF75_2445 [Desulfosporosinus sp. I2]
MLRLSETLMKSQKGKESDVGYENSSSREGVPVGNVFSKGLSSLLKPIFLGGVQESFS